QDKKGLNVYVSVDIEGMGGLTSNTEAVNGHEIRGREPRFSDDYERFRLLLTEEVNAVVRGLRAAGVSDILICDAHGGSLFRNIIVENIDDEEVRLVRGWPRDEMMMAALDDTYDMAFLVAYHANARTRNAVIAHCYAFSDFKVHGQRLNEAEINALYAGEYGIPIGLISGDDKLIGQVSQSFPEAEKIITKEGLSRSAAIVLHPGKVRRMLEEQAKKAVERFRAGEKFKPFTMKKPYNIEFTVSRGFGQFIDQIAKLRENLEKTGERSFKYTTDSMKDMLRLIDEIERFIL
ncbi:M55 family metallopeptidase, partial [candidate division KSB1 bacterium]